jgi:putative ABC transport system ATP-binding protein
MVARHQSGGPILSVAKRVVRTVLSFTLSQGKYPMHAPASQSPAVDLAGVALTLPSAAGPVAILRGISLRIPAGQTVALLGPSGSGKSSLLMVAAGLEAPTEGRVILAGTELGGLNEDELARFRGSHIGIVFQSFHLIPTMTALENVAIPLELAGRRDAFACARDELAAVGLAARAAHYPAQLSGGEQQRIALARAMAPRPTVLFADEPTGNLDAATGEIVADLLFSLHQQTRTTLFLVTHDERLAQRCQRILRLKDGAIVADETMQF